MMRLTVAAVGRLPKRAPERDLIDDYRTRFDRAARSVGLGPLVEAEVEVRRGAPGPDAEAEALRRAVSGSGALIAMDERGVLMSSPDLAGRLAGYRDAGQGALAIVIGGADGLAPDLRDEADLVVSFGPMVWPHALARVMVFEQLYRAATILTGSPYHRV